MVKYARIVFETTIDEDASEQEILDAMESQLTEFMNNLWGINDVEIHNRPYIADECSADIIDDKMEDSGE